MFIVRYLEQTKGSEAELILDWGRFLRQRGKTVCDVVARLRAEGARIARSDNPTLQVPWRFAAAPQGIQFKALVEGWNFHQIAEAMMSTEISE